MAEATQTKTTIAIDPVTRIEGHLKAEVVVENGKVVDAKLTGGMYRGFESILRGPPPPASRWKKPAAPRFRATAAPPVT